MIGSPHIEMELNIFFVLYICVIWNLNSVLSFLVDSHTSRKQYAMYVWRDGFDRNIQGCDETEFLKWDERHSHCFTHTWNAHEKRKWLWSTCNLPGREVSTIFLADVYRKLKPAMETGDCHSQDVELIRTTLTEGHGNVPGLKIYALFAASDPEVSEQHMVKYVVWYNDVCARKFVCLFLFACFAFVGCCTRS